MFRWLLNLLFRPPEYALADAPYSRQIPMREVTMSELTATPNVIEYDQTGMAPTERCDRCGGQAYVEILTRSDHTLLFCGHHYTENEAKLLEVAALVSDHRKFLYAQEHAH